MQKIFLPNNYCLYVKETPSLFFTTVEFSTKTTIEELICLNEHIIVKDVDFFLQTFIPQKLKIIEAAGGLVTNQKNELLFIYRKGKWDLPKGKIEPNEEITTAAIREVQEETGVQKITIIKDLDISYHIYYNPWKQNEYVLKKTYWKKMLCDSNEILKPQIEEDITAVKWISLKNIAPILNNTYPLIKDLLQKI